MICDLAKDGEKSGKWWVTGLGRRAQLGQKCTIYHLAPPPSLSPCHTVHTWETQGKKVKPFISAVISICVPRRGEKHESFKRI